MLREKKVDRFHSQGGVRTAKRGRTARVKMEIAHRKRTCSHRKEIENLRKQKGWKDGQSIGEGSQSETRPRRGVNQEKTIVARAVDLGCRENGEDVLLEREAVIAFTG